MKTVLFKSVQPQSIGWAGAVRSGRNHPVSLYACELASLNHVSVNDGREEINLPIRGAIRAVSFGLGYALILLTISILLLGGSAAAVEKPVLRIAYTEWSSSVAGAHLVQAVLQEELGCQVYLQRMGAEDMWLAVAEGKADVMLSAWMPVTHEQYYERYGKHMVDLGPNLEGARIGLVVPDVSVGRQTGPQGRRVRPYIKAESIADLGKYGKEFRRRIIGIDPGAGIMQRTREAQAAYGLDEYRLIEGSEVSMTAELSNAIRHQEWIVVTGWTPHWMFARWNLRFLEDPQKIYGGPETIHTMVRSGLQDDMPVVYTFLDRFFWTQEDAAQFMIWNQSDNGLYPYEKALRWMRTHSEQVSQWLEGLK
ncbi:MAG: glycine betaine ABC transporter substrate-binding protein [Desulfobulbaceae bacterium]|nr:glycine betaine ABC transporter substrate-binding protein [Desulfobulbaceae bacterium]